MSAEKGLPVPTDSVAIAARPSRGGWRPMSLATRSGLPVQDAVPAAHRRNAIMARTLLPLILTLAALHGPVTAQTYRWVDEQGDVHITDDVNSIPEARRPGSGPMTPPAKGSVPSPAPGGAAGPRQAPPGGGVALWLRTGGLRGEQEPVLIGVYDSEQACATERDRRTTMHVSHGMQPTSQPGLAMLNIGQTPAGDSYFAYRCVPAGIRPP
jgi:uncharacterized protein DUF4124